MGTLGKAAGAYGAFVAAHPSIVEWLLQRGRTYIYTTALPPALAHALQSSLDLIEGPEGAVRRAHLEALIANLLDTSRLEAGVLDIRRDPVDVSRVAQEAVDLVSHLHPDVDMLADIPTDLQIESGDAPRLRQILVNLLENASKYGDGRVEVRGSTDGESVRFEVEDSGPGVPAEERDAVFDRFHRLHEGQESGTGIGLYLVRALTNAHGGSVRIEDSRDLGGARFVLELPVGALELSPLATQR
jgi:signal transduction histidine kinase